MPLRATASPYAPSPYAPWISQERPAQERARRERARQKHRRRNRTDTGPLATSGRMDVQYDKTEGWKGRADKAMRNGHSEGKAGRYSIIGCSIGIVQRADGYVYVCGSEA
jgi:hypothetical protein